MKLVGWGFNNWMLSKQKIFWKGELVGKEKWREVDFSVFNRTKDNTNLLSHFDLSFLIWLCLIINEQKLFRGRIFKGFLVSEEL